MSQIKSNLSLREMWEAEDMKYYQEAREAREALEAKEMKALREVREAKEAKEIREVRETRSVRKAREADEMKVKEAQKFPNGIRIEKKKLQDYVYISTSKPRINFIIDQYRHKRPLEIEMRTDKINKEEITKLLANIANNSVFKGKNRIYHLYEDRVQDDEVRIEQMTTEKYIIHNCIATDYDAGFVYSYGINKNDLLDLLDSLLNL